MRISRVAIEREVSSSAEVERPRKASKEKWLSRSRSAPPSFNRIRKPVEETSGSCRVLYSRYNVNMCAGCSCTLQTHACTQIRGCVTVQRDRQTRWTNSLPLFYEILGEVALHRDPSAFCVKTYIHLELFLSYSKLLAIIIRGYTCETKSWILTNFKSPVQNL